MGAGAGDDIGDAAARCNLACSNKGFEDILLVPVYLVDQRVINAKTEGLRQPLPPADNAQMMAISGNIPAQIEACLFQRAVECLALQL